MRFHWRDAGAAGGAVMSADETDFRSAFMDLEPDIRDADLAAQIALEIAMRVQGDHATVNDRNFALFSIEQCRQLTMALHEKYLSLAKAM